MHFILYLSLLGLKRDKRGEFAWIEFFPSLPSVDHYNYLYLCIHFNLKRKFCDIFKDIFMKFDTFVRK